MFTKTNKITPKLLEKIAPIMVDDLLWLKESLIKGESFFFYNDEITLVIRCEKESLVLWCAVGCELLKAIDFVYLLAKHENKSNIKYYTVRGAALARYCKKYNPVFSGETFDGYDEFIVEVK